jgi:hypothetical protein
MYIPQIAACHAGQACDKLPRNMSRHHQPFVVEEISFFAALLPIAWLFTLMFGHKLFDRLRRAHRPARLLLTRPAE